MGLCMLLRPRPMQTSRPENSRSISSKLNEEIIFKTFRVSNHSNISFMVIKVMIIMSVKIIAQQSLIFISLHLSFLLLF